MIDPTADLERRITAIENDYSRLRDDVIKYTEHAISVMKAMTELAIQMQDRGFERVPPQHT